MSFIIAVAGKGGTGKTTICGLLIRYINEKFKKPVLAIDADPNMNLNEVLGVKVDHTIGSIREKVRENDENMPGGMSRIEYFQLMINQAVVEGSKVDLLVMGRPEGSGCYCAANNQIKKAMDDLSSKYAFTVIDNEAGMEHLSRHTTQNVDLLIIVSDSSWRGIQAGLRIKKLVEELKLNIKKQVLIINRISGEYDKEYYEEILENNLLLLGMLPEDEKVTEYDKKGIPLTQLPEDSKIVNVLFSLFDSLGTKGFDGFREL
ncbi:AAA family ATPase [Candidatus Desantisbacteria bacterium]|nr:AAA family ATPase [Candidatus Desantisbacteria bacterium]